jgi:hypothetical protein
VEARAHTHTHPSAGSVLGDGHSDPFDPDPSLGANVESGSAPAPPVSLFSDAYDARHRATRAKANNANRLWALAHSYCKRRREHARAKSLLQHCPGVDVDRFRRDVQYARELVKALACAPEADFLADPDHPEIAREGRALAPAAAETSLGAVTPTPADPALASPLALARSLSAQYALFGDRELLTLRLCGLLTRESLPATPVIEVIALITLITRD